MGKPINLKPRYAEPVECPKLAFGKVGPPPKEIPREQLMTMEEAFYAVGRAVPLGFWTLHTHIVEVGCHAVSLYYEREAHGPFYTLPDVLAHLFAFEEGGVDIEEEMEAAELAGFDPVAGAFGG